jgi:uncharacterized membrane protein
MSQTDQGLDLASRGIGTLGGDRGFAGDWAERELRQPGVNVGDSERVISVAGGSILALFGLTRGGLGGLLTAALGGGLIYRGATGYCPAYAAMEMDNAQDSQLARGVQLDQSLQINRSAEELYTFWRNFQNLPQIMTHLERVDVIDDRRSHWVAKVPAAGGAPVEWDAEITRDEPNTAIAWRSLPDATITNAGEVRFEPGLGDRGTIVHVHIDYLPPAGRIGHWIASLLGENPSRVVREDVRRFKRLMETGEIPTTDGQTRGTCTGQGQYQEEMEWKPLFR